jgi:hypothetical protein
MLSGLRSVSNHNGCLYRGPDHSLAQPASQCILFDCENISFDASFVTYINSTNIPPIMIVNRIYETQKSSVTVACFLPGRAKDLSAPQYNFYICIMNLIECVESIYIDFERW